MQMLTHLAKISETIHRHHLSWPLGIFGALVTVISFFTLVISVTLLSVGNVSIDPPSAIDPIIASGCGFILNRWFWSTVLFASVVGHIFGYWAHPEPQLRRKLGAQAVADYKIKNEWPWT